MTRRPPADIRAAVAPRSTRAGVVADPARHPPPPRRSADFRSVTLSFQKSSGSAGDALDSRPPLP